VGADARTDGWSACSWSGGKDSALALQLGIEDGARPGALLAMLEESGVRSRSHGLPVAVLEAQAAALDLRLVARSATWADYTAAFVDALAELADSGCSECIFGDIDIDDHLRWCEDVCAEAGVAARHPLWQRDRRSLVEGLLERRWTATIVVVRTPALDRSFLGRRLDPSLLEELEARGVDLCGENGEYHTVVTDGPLFAAPLQLSHEGEHPTADCLTLQVSLGSPVATREETIELPLGEVLANPRVDPEAHLDADRVASYAQKPEELPPVVVFETEEGRLLADGYHRLAAPRPDATRPRP
jgi:diphthine-ammonia ligase